MSRDLIILIIGLSMAVGYCIGYIHCYQYDKGEVPILGGPLTEGKTKSNVKNNTSHGRSAPKPPPPRTGLQ